MPRNFTNTKVKMLKLATVLIAVFVTIYVFRLQIMNQVQLYQLSGVGAQTSTSDARVFKSGALNQDHYLFKLRGAKKIFPHRVNSLQRLEYLYNNFEGFECDIIFEPSDQIFYLAHDPADISNFTFDQFLAFETIKKIYWLDVKNLSSGTIGRFKERLDHLSQKYNLKNRVIIETGDVTSLKILSSAGYLASFYIPADSLTSRNYSNFLNDDSILVSQDIRWLPHLLKRFPSNGKIVWDITFTHSMNKNILEKYASDTSILVCLMNIKSPGYR